MKKLICAAAALGLVAGVATTASAMDFSVTGFYQVEGYYLDNAEGAGFVTWDESGGDEAGSDSGWVHTFLMKPTLKVNDKITMKADLRFLKDTDWGTTGAGSMGIKGERDMDIHKIWMEYMSPIGKIRAGRTPGGAWQGAYMNTPLNKDRFYLFPKMDKPWGSYVFYQKATEADWSSHENDDDYDVYEACIYYTTKETKWALGYDYFNNKTNGDAVVPYDAQFHIAKAYMKTTLADLWIEAEIEYKFGDAMDYDVETVGVNEDTDVDTMAFMAAVGTSFDNLKVSALYFYASGDDDITAGDDVENALGAGVGTGDGFNPYYILTGDHTAMLNSDEYAANGMMTQLGVHCIGISADLAVSDKLTLHGAIAYAMSAEDEVRYGAGALDVEEFDDEYGWEIDLGAKYKLLDNLTYEARAAYMDLGDAFGDYKDAGVTVTVDEASDLVLLSHHLTMTF
jgi:hypothetical protein